MMTLIEYYTLITTCFESENYFSICVITIDIMSKTSNKATKRPNWNQSSHSTVYPENKQHRESTSKKKVLKKAKIFIKAFEYLPP